MAGYNALIVMVSWGHSYTQLIKLWKTNVCRFRKIKLCLVLLKMLVELNKELEPFLIVILFLN